MKICSKTFHLTLLPCITSCYLFQNNYVFLCSTSADFTCAILDCPEFLGVPIRSGCYRTYELGQCCSTGQICSKFFPEFKSFSLWW